MKTSVQRARATIQPTEVKSVKNPKNATQESNPKSTTKSNPQLKLKLASNPKPSAPSKAAAKPVAAPARSTPVSSPPKLSAKKPVAAKPELKKAVAPAPQKSVKPKAVVTSKVSAAAKKPAALHATKKRAPKDLAMQYGEVVNAARAPIAAAAPRKRRNAASRAKLQAVITPDDGLMQRLARAGSISSSHVAANSDDEADQPMRALSTRRSRKWETLCGKCGASAQYSTSAALCVKCGAILVRN